MRTPWFAMVLAAGLPLAHAEGVRADTVSHYPTYKSLPSRPLILASLDRKDALPVWTASPVPRPPKTPAGLPPCAKTLTPVGDLPRLAGETIRYVVDVNGLSLGTIDFKIERRGTYQGQPVIEYRSLFKLDSLVSTFVPVEGRAATIVPEVGFWPKVAMNRYRLDNSEIEESMTYTGEGKGVKSRRSKDGQPKDEQRSFPMPVQDFVSGFYMLRRLPANMDGCTIIYGNQRAYTVWIKPDGQETVKTPVGLKQADRYEVRYASDRSQKMLTGRVWLGAQPERLPYKAEVNGQQHLEARIHMYEAGK